MLKGYLLLENFIEVSHKFFIQRLEECQELGQETMQSFFSMFLIKIYAFWKLSQMYLKQKSPSFVE